jgi:drug/metabolite transporter (DMT)-like permease
VRGEAAAGIRANPYLLLSLAALFWSLNHVLGRAVTGHAPPFGITLVRWFFGALLILPFAWPHLPRDWQTAKRHWRIVLFLAMTGGTIFGALQYLGLQLTTAMNTSVLNSLMPVFVVAAGGLLFRDRLGLLPLLGIATSLTGVIAIVTRGDFAVLAGLAFNWGDVVIVFNMGVMAIYSACLRLLPPMNAMSFVFLLAAISTIGTVPLAAWEYAEGMRFDTSWITLVTAVYVPIFPGVGAMLAFNRGVELIGANRGGVFMHLIPLYTALFATTFLGERLQAFHVAGFALIHLGVCLAARKA